MQGKKGFGYLTYNNELRVSFLGTKELGDNLTFNDFKKYSTENNLLYYQSVIPMGKALYTSLLNSDGTISNGYVHLKNVINFEDIIVDNNNSIMWIIVGACFAVTIFTALSLGIGIRIRRKAKLQLVITKLANKKIDMLSTTVAKSFKKLAENTNALLKNQSKALVMTENPTTLSIRRRSQQPPRPIRPTGPVRRPVGSQQPTR